MTRGVRVRLGILAVALAALFPCVTATSRTSGGALPERLDDRAFWSLVTEFSEPNGTFRSDNFVSNEMAYEQVIPTLQAELLPASAYIGVGPDQNFTYLAALRPKIAFIVDIRRQNLLLHLMYKALIEDSPTRAEFLSRLFSRPIPPGLGVRTTADTMLGAFQHTDPDGIAFERNRQDVRRRLLDVHGFSLSPSDLGGSTTCSGRSSTPVPTSATPSAADPAGSRFRATRT